MEDFDDDDMFHVNYGVIAADTKMSVISRTLAKDIMERGYMTVGMFFENLADRDVDQLLDMVEEANRDEETLALKELAVIAMMLYQAEGGADISVDLLDVLLRAIRMLVVVTSLDRKGMVKAYYNNYSFNEDMAAEVIATRIDSNEDE